VLSRISLQGANPEDAVAGRTAGVAQPRISSIVGVLKAPLPQPTSLDRRAGFRCERPRGEVSASPLGVADGVVGGTHDDNVLQNARRDMPTHGSSSSGPTTRSFPSTVSVRPAGASAPRMPDRSGRRS
jgi:hypothetical protein